MMNFQNNNISNSYTTVSELLRSKREEKGLNFKKIARKININPSYLKALEEERYQKIPDGVYQTKILKKYASFLGLSTKELEEKFIKEKSALHDTDNNSLFSVKRVEKKNFLVLPKILRGALLGGLILICFICLGVYLNGVFSPPELKVTSPSSNDIVTSERQIMISGETEPETEILINNNLISNRKNGFFEKEIDLKEGVNTITVTAQKKYGQKTVVEKQVLVEEQG